MKKTTKIMLVLMILLVIPLVKAADTKIVLPVDVPAGLQPTIPNSESNAEAGEGVKECKDCPAGYPKCDSAGKCYKELNEWECFRNTWGKVTKEYPPTSTSGGSNEGSGSQSELLTCPNGCKGGSDAMLNRRPTQADCNPITGTPGTALITEGTTTCSGAGSNGGEKKCVGSMSSAWKKVEGKCPTTDKPNCVEWASLQCTGQCLDKTKYDCDNSAWKSGKCMGITGNNIQCCEGKATETTLAKTTCKDNSGKEYKVTESYCMAIEISQPRAWICTKEGKMEEIKCPSGELIGCSTNGFTGCITKDSNKCQSDNSCTTVCHPEEICEEDFGGVKRKSSQAKMVYDGGMACCTNKVPDDVENLEDDCSYNTDYSQDKCINNRPCKCTSIVFGSDKWDCGFCGTGQECKVEGRYATCKDKTDFICTKEYEGYSCEGLYPLCTKPKGDIEGCCESKDFCARKPTASEKIMCDFDLTKMDVQLIFPEKQENKLGHMYLGNPIGRCEGEETNSVVAKCDSNSDQGCAEIAYGELTSDKQFKCERVKGYNKCTKVPVSGASAVASTECKGKAEGTNCGTACTGCQKCKAEVCIDACKYESLGECKSFTLAKAAQCKNEKKCIGSKCGGGNDKVCLKTGEKFDGQESETPASVAAAGECVTQKKNQYKCESKKVSKCDGTKWVEDTEAACPESCAREGLCQAPADKGSCCGDSWEQVIDDTSCVIKAVKSEGYTPEVQKPHQNGHTVTKGTEVTVKWIRDKDGAVAEKKYKVNC